MKFDITEKPETEEAKRTKALALDLAKISTKREDLQTIEQLFSLSADELTEIVDRVADVFDFLTGVLGYAEMLEEEAEKQAAEENGGKANC